jgi:CHAD domain-containing protein
VTAFKEVLRREREDARRKAIKAIESIPLAALVPSERDRLRRRWRGSGDLKVKLREQMRLRSRELSDAIEHASGVYFPNRTHQVRVCAKRLRYVVELASHVGRWRSDREVKILTRVQEVLGEVHDREVLIERLSDVSGDDRTEIDAVRTRLTHERDDFFKKYLSLRDALSEVADSIRESTDARSWNWSLLAAAVGIPSALVVGLVTAERRRPSEQPKFLQPVAGRK